MMKAPLVITGIHRSGTTWVGKIIESTTRVDILHEPLNLQHGLRDIPCWYPYTPGGAPDLVSAPHARWIEEKFAQFFAGHAPYVRAHPKAPFHRRLARAIFGSSMERAYRAALRGGSSRTVCLKDPFCLFLLPHLIERYDARAAIVIRHPGALLVSMRRMGWKSHVDSLTSQPGLLNHLDDRLHPLIANTQTCPSDVDALAIFWIIALRLSVDAQQRFPGNVLLVRHEDLSQGSEHTLSSLLKHLELQVGFEPAHRFIQSTTNCAQIAPPAGVIHEFSRDGAALVDYWKSKLTALEMERLLSIVEPDLSRLYEIE